jgi:hypothetical protein
MLCYSFVPWRLSRLKIYMSIEEGNVQCPPTVKTFRKKETATGNVADYFY